MSELDFKIYRTSKEAMDAMHSSILLAQNSIYWELYSLADDNIGNIFIDNLCELSRKGVEVKIILDAIGSFDLSRAAINKMRSAGVDLIFYNSLIPRISIFSWLKSLWNRNHRKILVIDRKTVFIGGVNIAATYTEWDDIHLRIENRPVESLLRAFARSYIRCGGKRKNVRYLLKREIKSDWQRIKTRARYILHSPVSLHPSPVRKIYLKSLANAKKSFNLLTPYFVPDKEFFKLIVEATKRGVKVNIILPLRAEMKFLQLIAIFYAKMAHRAGAEVYLSTKMNHGKAMTADNKIGFIGSVNFTPRSFYYNEEGGLLFRDQDMVENLNSIFEEIKINSTIANEKNFFGSGWLNNFKGWVGKHLGDWI